MASDAYHSICNSLYNQIYQRLERCEDERRRFVTRGTSKQVLHDDMLRQFLRSLALSEFESRMPYKVLVDRVKQRKLYDFLATLIFAACSIHAARSFVTKLVAVDTWPVLDRREKPMGLLPADREQLEELFGLGSFGTELFGNTVDADKFLTKQACFCAVVLRKRGEVRVKDVDCQRLPYLEESQLGQGSFGKVFRVRVAKGHFYDPHTDTGFHYNTAPKDIARKDYIVSDAFRAKEEYQIMKKILSSPSRSCENVVESLGCLEVGTNYSLFMPLAICDLRAYMMVNHHIKPSTREGKSDMIRCAAGLAGGLNFLHSEMRTPDLDDLVCYHMDLTPSNILIFRESSSDGFHNVWKLSDFGMARVKIRRHGQGGVKEKDFDSLFVRRQKLQDPSFSATVNRRGEGTYLAPESISATPSMRTGSDVWSLGCVVSVVMTYLEEGGDGVTRYQGARIQHRNADGYDRFFLRGTRFTPAQVHPQVKAWHTQLIDRATKRDAKEGEAVAYLLRSLENCVLKIDQSRRCDAKRVKVMLEDTFKLYRKLGDTSSDTAPRMRMLPHNPIKNMLSRNVSSTRGRVNEWCLESSDNFKGCVISPDATHVVYWTDIKIVLYTSQALPYGDGSNVAQSAEYSLSETDCFWKSVCLTSKYLIASTTGRNHCYIFDLEGGTAVDANLDDMYRIALRMPEVHMLAISPDSANLACVARNEDEFKGPASLFYAAVSDLIAFAKPRPSRQNEETSDHEPINQATLEPQCWKSLDLEWPAADVVYLSISDTNDVHLVVRPELTARSREHKIPVTHVSLSHSTIDTLNIESRGFDSSSTVGFFTAFCPFRYEATCAVVTREKRLLIQRFAEHDASRDVQKDIPNYRVRKLLMNYRDDRFFALGTTSANNRMLLLEIQVPQPGVAIEIRQVAQLPGLSYEDDTSEMLSHGTEDKYMLVAALTGSNRRTIYRVAIP